jgi:hypothetical protein
MEAKDEIARIMRTPVFDEEMMGEMFVRHDDRLRDLRLRLVGALARIHEALDDDQRERLADMLGGGRSFGSPYRGRGRGPRGGGFA